MEKTLEQTIYSQILHSVSKDPNDIVQLLRKAGVQDPLKKALTNCKYGHMNRSELLSQTLYYGLENADMHSAFCNRMPVEFLNKIPDLRTNKHPNIHLCMKIACELLKYNDMMFVVDALLDEVAKTEPVLVEKVASR